MTHPNPGKDTQEQAREKALDIRITVLFKKYFVTRPEGNCQVLFALTKLDELVSEIMQEVQPEIDQLKREAQAYAESVDNVREVLGLEATHYLIIHDEVIAALSRARCEGMEEAAGLIPVSWLDDLLTGNSAVIGKPPYGCPEVEKLLWAVGQRIRRAAKEVDRG